MAEAMRERFAREPPRKHSFSLGEKLSIDKLRHCFLKRQKTAGRLYGALGTTACPPLEHALPPSRADALFLFLADESGVIRAAINSLTAVAPERLRS